MRADVVLFVAFGTLFGLIAAVFALYHGYVEDSGMKPVDNVLEIAVFSALAIACGVLALVCARAPADDEDDGRDH